LNRLALIGQRNHPSITITVHLVVGYASASSITGSPPKTPSK
jgi:hypothetical protein